MNFTKDQNGSKNHQSKLTEDSVRRIRAKHREGKSAAELAKEIGVSKSTITRVVRRQSWKHVE